MSVNADDDDDDDDDETDEDSDCQFDDGDFSACDRNGRENIAALTDEELLLCRARLKGYSLRNKKWRMLTLPT